MRASNILQLGIKELRGLARDPMLIALILYAFTLSIYTASRAMPETLNRAVLAVVDEDRSPVASRLIGAFYPLYFMPPALISQSEMDRRMDAGTDISPSTSRRASSRTCSPDGHRRSSSTSMRRASRRPSPAAATSRRSCRPRSRNS